MRARHFVAVTVVGAWGVGVALFARREMRRPAAEQLAAVAMRVAPGATWLTVERDGKQVGFESITVDTMPHELRVTEYLVVDAPAAGGSARRTQQTTIRLSRGLLIRAFERATVAGTDSLRVKGQAVNDSVVSLSWNGSGIQRSGRLTHAGAVLAGPLVPMIAALEQPPRVGAKLRYDVLDIDRGAARSLEIRVTAETTFVLSDSAAFDAAKGRWNAVHADSARAWRLTSDDGSPEVWVDELGKVVSGGTTDGLRLRRTAFELAFENWRLANPMGGVSARADGIVVSSTLLAAGAVDAFVPLDTLRLQLRSASPVARAFGAAYRSGNMVTTTRSSAEGVASRYVLPLDERSRRAHTFALRVEPRIEVDDPAIVRLATRLRGNARDPQVVARAILAWVRDSITNDPAAAPASAARALMSRRGDCGERARLFIALTRAAGIPSRGVAGLLYAGGKLYYHAWAEFLAGGAMVAVDPSLGQMPVDAAHIPWTTGSLELQAELMRVMAGLDVRVDRVVHSPSSDTRP